jgi:hypothetical protein
MAVIINNTFLLDVKLCRRYKFTDVSNNHALSVFRLVKFERKVKVYSAASANVYNSPW